MQRITKTQNFTANAQNMDLDVTDANFVTLSLKGTFVATVTFYVSDDGTDFYPVFMTPSNSATSVGTGAALGLWKVDVSPYKTFRVGTTAFTSGTVTALATASLAYS